MFSVAVASRNTSSSGAVPSSGCKLNLVLLELRSKSAMFVALHWRERGNEHGVPLTTFESI